MPSSQPRHVTSVFHGEMTDMKQGPGAGEEKKNERKSVDTKKVKGKSSWIVGPGPWERLCPLHLPGREVGRVGFVKLSEYHIGVSITMKRMRIFIRSDLQLLIHSNNKSGGILPQLMIRLQILVDPKAALQLLSLQTCCCQ